MTLQPRLATPSPPTRRPVRRPRTPNSNQTFIVSQERVLVTSSCSSSRPIAAARRGCRWSPRCRWARSRSPRAHSLGMRNDGRRYLYFFGGYDGFKPMTCGSSTCRPMCSARSRSTPPRPRRARGTRRTWWATCCTSGTTALRFAARCTRSTAPTRPRWRALVRATRRRTTRPPQQTTTLRTRKRHRELLCSGHAAWRRRPRPAGCLHEA